MKRIRNLSICNAISFLIHLIFSFLVQTKLFNNADVGEISERFPSLFTPAGFTFAIWIVIYLALFLFCAFHLLMAFTRSETHPTNRDLSRIGWLFIINNLATAAWLVAWVNELILLSVVLILLQLTTLIIIHIRLRIHNAHSSFAAKLFTQFPLSIYLGWISIASVANISSWLTCAHWSGWGISPINWTITVIALTVFLTVGVINRKKNVFFGLVVLWALYGIMSKRAADDEQVYEPVIMVIYGAMAIIAFASLFGLIRNLREKRSARTSALTPSR